MKTTFLIFLLSLFYSLHAQVVEFNTKQYLEISQSFMGQDMSSVLENEMSGSVTITTKKPNSAHLSISIKKIIIDGEAMGMPIKFNSDLQENKNDRVGASLQKLLENKIELSLSSDSTEKDINKNDFKNLFGNSFGGLSFNTELGQDFFFPFSITGIGDSIIDKSKSGRLISYLIKEKSDGIATIIFKGFENTKTREDEDGVEIVITAKTEFFGQMLVYTKTGIIKWKKTEKKSTLISEFADQSITINTKQQIESTTSEVYD